MKSGETAEDFLTRIRPNWRTEAAASGAYWRKTFQTLPESYLQALAETAAIKLGCGSDERQRRLCERKP